MVVTENAVTVTGSVTVKFVYTCNLVTAKNNISAAAYFMVPM